MRGKRGVVPVLVILAVLLTLVPRLGPDAVLARANVAQSAPGRYLDPPHATIQVATGKPVTMRLQQSETPTPESGVSLPDLLRPVLSPSATPEATSEPTAEPTIESSPEVPQIPNLIETPVAEGTPTVSSADAETFAALLQSQANAETLAGPFNANLKETEGSISLSWSDLAVTDFHASAVVDVPAESSDVPWDAGFIFRQSPAGTFRIAISADGNWYFSIGTDSPTASGPISSLQTDAGASNTLDLMVEGQSAWLGVNGELAGVVSLPSDGEAADVALGTGFYSNEVVTDRVTPFQDFVVRALPAGSLGAGTGTSQDAAEEFQSILGKLDAATPVAGPFAGRLVEATAGTVPVAPAGVEVSDFAAAATFTNPDKGTETLWDFGYQFRDSESERNRVVIDSNGDIYTTLAGQESAQAGHSDAFDTAPGASNTLQLFVVGKRAYFGVNGEFAAAIDLPAEPLTSDVLVGAGFFTLDFLVGWVSDYKDFSVWDLTSP
jgi:hypothetical protein